MDHTFTSQAQRVLRLAGDEARRFNSGHLSTEHLLLALLHEKAGPAARVLARPGVDCLVVWREINRGSATAHTPTQVGPLPRTPRVKLALDRARDEARRLGPDTPVGPRQLLIGLLSDPECVASAILLKLGVRIAEVCDELRAEPCEVQENPFAISASADESICRDREIDHVQGTPACSLPGHGPGLDLPERMRSLRHEGPLGRIWRFLLRLLKIKAAVAASRCADEPSE